MSQEAIARLNALQEVVNAYVDEYVLDDGESVHHIPSEEESALIMDAIQGLLADEQFVQRFNEWQAVVIPILAARDAIRQGASHG